MVSRNLTGPESLIITPLTTDDVRARNSTTRLPGFGSDIMSAAVATSAIIPSSHSSTAGMLHELQAALPSTAVDAATTAAAAVAAVAAGDSGGDPSMPLALAGHHDTHHSLGLLPEKSSLDGTYLGSVTSASPSITQNIDRAGLHHLHHAQHPDTNQADHGGIQEGASYIQYVPETSTDDPENAFNGSLSATAAAVANVSQAAAALTATAPSLATYPTLYSVGNALYANQPTSNQYYELASQSSTNTTPTPTATATAAAAAAAAAGGQLFSLNGSTYLIQPGGATSLLASLDPPLQGQHQPAAVAPGTLGNKSPAHQQHDTIATAATGGTAASGAAMAQFQGQMIGMSQGTPGGGESVAAAAAGMAGKYKTPNLSYATRVSPETIQWLISNYEATEGVSLPRSTLYSHYEKHCADSKQEPVNAASFGKLIRSVFLGLRTRRIGTRGNSKYHYYGIRVKPESPLNLLPDLPAQQPTSQKVTTPNSSHRKRSNLSQGMASNLNQQTDLSSSSSNRVTSNPERNSPNSTTTGNDTFSSLNGSQHFGSTSTEILGFPSIMISEESLPPELDLATVDGFPNQYRLHCIDVFEAVVAMNFNRVESIWQAFWNHSRPQIKSEVLAGDQTPANNGNLTSPPGMESTEGMPSTSGMEDKILAPDSSSSSMPPLPPMLHKAAPLNIGTGPGALDMEAGSLSAGKKKDQLVLRRMQYIVKLPQVQSFIREADFAFYQKLVDFLMPKVLKSIPNSLTLAIRNFAKSLEGYMSSATEGLDPDLRKIKLSTVKALSQILRRYTGLNHLAQAARAVLQSSALITKMLNDLNRVDFNNVQEQSSWVCQCDPALVRRLESEFKTTLQEQKGLENWARWLENVVESVLSSQQLGKEEYPKAARNFLLRWSFYSSMVIRDLTLRSAESFGSFHLIRLLYDEYMFYLVEQRLARYLNQKPITVMVTDTGLGGSTHSDPSSYFGSYSKSDLKGDDDNIADQLFIAEEPVVENGSNDISDEVLLSDKMEEDFPNN